MRRATRVNAPTHARLLAAQRLVAAAVYEGVRHAAHELARGRVVVAQLCKDARGRHDVGGGEAAAARLADATLRDGVGGVCQDGIYTT